jgi:hypothetical protein
LLLLIKFFIWLNNAIWKKKLRNQKKKKTALFFRVGFYISSNSDICFLRGFTPQNSDWPDRSGRTQSMHNINIHMKRNEKHSTVPLSCLFYQTLFRILKVRSCPDLSGCGKYWGSWAKLDVCFVNQYANTN